METRSKAVVAGLLLLLFAGAVVAIVQTSAAAEKTAAGKIYHLSSARGPIRAVETTPLGNAVSSEIVAGPANGLDSAFLVYTRMPAGAHGPAMFTLPVVHSYLVLSGELTVQIGTDKYVLKPDSLAWIPAGVPHEVWNAGSEPESDIEVVMPAPSRDLETMMKSAQARKVENTMQYIRVPMPLSDSGRGANSQPLLARATGSTGLQERIDNVKPGAGVGPGLHVHGFDQIYFVLQGTMTLQYGIDKMQVQKHSFVIIPTGVVHQNRNESADMERHVTLLLPEPEKEPFDLPVEFKAAPTRPPGSN